MNRRRILSALALAPFIAEAARGAVPQPFKVTLLSGGLDGPLWQAGILIEMEPGWKTYWRVPGDTGIPPQFDWTGSTNSGSIDVGFPIPARFSDLAGESIGYHDRVVFPVSVLPGKAEDAVSLQLNLFFAVCKEICIPAKAKAGVLLNSPASNPLLEDWLKRVPRVVAMGQAPVVTSVRLEMQQEKPMLVLALARAAQDVFVESGTTAFFGKPRFDIAAGEAWLPVANLEGAEKLRGVPLKITLSFGDSGIEQKLVLN